MASRLTVLFSAAALGAALSATPAFAQARGGGRGMVAPGTMTLTLGSGQRGQGARGQGGRRGGFGRGHRGGRHGPRGPVVYPYPYPYWYPDGGYDEGVAPPEPPQPPAPDAAAKHPPAAAPVPPSPPPESLLLEFRDGQWIRVPTGEKLPAGPLATQPQPAEAPSPETGPTGGNRAAQAPPKLRNVVLVFRDGRRENIRKYMIHGDVLYASEEYWKTGSWTKKIPIAELNIPETLQVNRERGVKFDLPSGPSEVVVGF